MVDFEFKNEYDINDLVEITKILRSENGCSWDKEQTHDSIRNDFLEEAYEVAQKLFADKVDNKWFIGVTYPNRAEL